jgi:hypothetical protein
MLEQIRQLAAESDAETLDDHNRIAARVSGIYNRTPQSEMGGHSPEQVHTLTSPSWIGSSVIPSQEIPYSAVAETPTFHNARHLLKTIHAASPPVHAL